MVLVVVVIVVIALVELSSWVILVLSVWVALSLCRVLAIIPRYFIIHIHHYSTRSRFLYALVSNLTLLFFFLVD